MINVMKIEKKNDNIVIRIPLWQAIYDATGQRIGEMSNIIGMIERDEMGFAKVVDLGYKDSFDYSEIIVKVLMGKEEFKKLCKELNIGLYECPLCVKCGGVVYGVHGWNNGPVCSDCEYV